MCTTSSWLNWHVNKTKLSDWLSAFFSLRADTLTYRLWHCIEVKTMRMLHGISLLKLQQHHHAIVRHHTCPWRHSESLYLGSFLICPLHFFCCCYLKCTACQTLSFVPAQEMFCTALVAFGLLIWSKTSSWNRLVSENQLTYVGTVAIQVTEDSSHQYYCFI